MQIEDERKILSKEDLIRCNAVCSGSRCTECVMDWLRCDFRHAGNSTLKMDAKMQNRERCDLVMVGEPEGQIYIRKTSSVLKMVLK